MFGYKRPERVKRQIEKLESERDALNDDLFKTRNQLAELKQKRKMEDDEIRHLVKIKESQLDIDHQKKLIEADREKEISIAAVKDEYRDKMEKELSRQIDRMQQMYGEILGRLPNVNVRLKGDV